MKCLLLIFSLSITGSLFSAEQFSALVFSDAHDKFHYGNVPAVREAFESLSKKNRFELTFVDTDRSFAKEVFANYDVIVFVSANPCELDEEKRAEFQDFVAKGGAVVGVHSASATRNEPRRWSWWEELIGRVFTSHPAVQSGIISVVDHEHLSCMHLDSKFLWTDEWYSFETPVPESLNILLTVDEDSYRLRPKQVMGEGHPIAWYHEPNGARVFYTALGHIPENYSESDFQKHILGGMLWAVGSKAAGN